MATNRGNSGRPYKEPIAVWICNMNYHLLDSIGNTPLVEIKKLNPYPKVRILAKLEYLNPGGSIKDRAALEMIKAGENSGELTPDKTVIEATSGNTGIGLALVCAVKGYQLLLAMSEAVSIERRKILQARGAEILLTPGHLGTDGAIEEVYRLARENPEAYFMADQFNNPANWQAHYNGTAPEIWQQTQGRVSHFIATMGTTGTLMGVQRRLKEYNPEIQVIGVEPYLGHKIQGLKNMREAYCPEIFDKRLLDRKVNIEDETAFEMTRQLAQREGLFVGMSSGAVLAIALQEAKMMDSGTIVVIFPDGGERYLSTPLFTVKDTIGIQLFNTLNRGKENFESQQPGKVSIFTCGPTVHRNINIGDYRRIVFGDMLGRYFAYRGYTVHQVMNVTDLDDKSIAESQEAEMRLEDFTAENISKLKNDLNTLNVSPTLKYAVTSDHIPAMVRLAEKLVQKGYAYEKLRSLYFNIARSKDYGQLSGVDINKIRLGATVDLDEYEKDNPRDFTLFKRSRLSELKRGIFTKTSWGNVRPSWHIQSSALANKFMGENLDIYISSRELMFPHNENEIAIAQALTGHPLARYWIHCDRILAKGRKIDQHAAGPTIDDLTEAGYSGEEIRFWLISSNYRKPIIYSQEQLGCARRSLNRINGCIFALMQYAETEYSYKELDQLLYDLKNGFSAAMDDDLNISAAIASIFQLVKRVNTLMMKKQLAHSEALKILEVFKNINNVLQVFDFKDKFTQPEIQTLIKQREDARQSHEWDLADKLRERLLAMGIEIRDTKV